jgi:hypothetical protein
MLNNIPIHSAHIVHESFDSFQDNEIPLVIRPPEWMRKMADQQIIHGPHQTVEIVAWC